MAGTHNRGIPSFCGAGAGKRLWMDHEGITYSTLSRSFLGFARL